jgi:hypothetical protein
MSVSSSQDLQGREASRLLCPFGLFRVLPSVALHSWSLLFVWAGGGGKTDHYALKNWSSKDVQATRGTFMFKPLGRLGKGRLGKGHSKGRGTCEISDKCMALLRSGVNRKHADGITWDAVAKDFVQSTLSVWPDGYPGTKVGCNPCENKAVTPWYAQPHQKPIELKQVHTKLVSLAGSLTWRPPCSFQFLQDALGLYSIPVYQMFASLSQRPVDYMGESQTFRDFRYGYVVKTSVARATTFPEGKTSSFQSHWIGVLKISCDRGCSEWLVNRQLLCSAVMTQTLDSDKLHPLKPKYGCSKAGCVCATNPLRERKCLTYQGTCLRKPDSGSSIKCPHEDGVARGTRVQGYRDIYACSKDQIDRTDAERALRCSKKQQYRPRLKFVSVRCNGTFVQDAANQMLSRDSFIMQ